MAKPKLGKRVVEFKKSAPYQSSFNANVPYVNENNIDEYDGFKKEKEDNDIEQGLLHYMGIETFLNHDTGITFNRVVAFVERFSDSCIVRIDPEELKMDKYQKY